MVLNSVSSLQGALLAQCSAGQHGNFWTYEVRMRELLIRFLSEQGGAVWEIFFFFFYNKTLKTICYLMQFDERKTMVCSIPFYLV